jgi:hypothetical protein
MASINVCFFVVLASVRLLYPFELEWIEGGYMDYVRWIADGNALYPPASLAFIPANKTPLFMIVSAGLTHLTGPTFVAPRLLSILATLGCFVLLVMLVWQQTRSISGGLAAAGLYAAAFHLTGAWMDIARPDSLCLFFVLLSFWVAQQYGNHLGGMLMSGLCALLAYYTKQIALPTLLVVAGYSLLTTRGATWLSWALTVLSGVFVFFLLDMLSDGWFSFYTFDRIAQKQWGPDIWRFWWILIEHAWPLLLLGLLVFVHALVITRQGWSHHHESRAADMPPPVWGYLALAGGLLASSWSVFLQIWTYVNGLMPVVLGLCLLTGLAFGETDRRQFAWAAQDAPVLRILVLLLMLWQYTLLTYDPRVLVPTTQDRLAGQQFVERLSEFPDDTLVYHHGYFAYLAGKPSYFHSSFLGDALVSCSDELAAHADPNAHRCEHVQQMWLRAITRQHFDHVIVDNRPENWLPYYLPSELLFEPDSTVFYPVTGAQTRPTHLLRRNPLVYGGTVHFADPQADYLAEHGLSVREEWGRWSDASQVTLEIALEQQDYKLALTAFPFCHALLEQQQIMVYWNQHMLGTYTYETCDNQRATFDLPDTYITSGMDELRIEIAHTATPFATSGADDNRHLGVGLVSLSLERLP